LPPGAAGVKPAGSTLVCHLSISWLLVGSKRYRTSGTTFASRGGRMTGPGVTVQPLPKRAHPHRPDLGARPRARLDWRHRFGV